MVKDPKEFKILKEYNNFDMSRKDIVSLYEPLRLRLLLLLALLLVDGCLCFCDDDDDDCGCGGCCC